MTCAACRYFILGRCILTPGVCFNYDHFVQSPLMRISMTELESNYVSRAAFNGLKVRVEKAEYEVAKLQAMNAELERESEFMAQAFLETETISSNGSLRGSILALQKTINGLRNELEQWKTVAFNLADELTESNSERFPVSWEDASESSPAWIAYVNLRDKSSKKGE